MNEVCAWYIGGSRTVAAASTLSVANETSVTSFQRLMIPATQTLKVSGGPGVTMDWRVRSSASGGPLHVHYRFVGEIRRLDLVSRRERFDRLPIDICDGRPSTTTHTYGRANLGSRSLYRLAEIAPRRRIARSPVGQNGAASGDDETEEEAKCCC